MLTGYQTFRSWDISADAELVRIVGYTGRGSYWVTRPLAPAGKSRRVQVDEALELIEIAVEDGAEPGEVIPHVGGR